MTREKQLDRIKAIALAFKAGVSAIDVAAEFNITRAYVYWCAKRAKAPKRKRGKA